MSSVRLLRERISNSNQPFGKQTNVEPKMRRPQIDLLFFRGEQIHQQGREFPLVEQLCDVAIARTMPAAPASMGKQNDSPRAFRQAQITFETNSPDPYRNQALHIFMYH